MRALTRIDRRRMRGNFSAHAEDYDRNAVVQQKVVEQLCARLSGRDTGPGLLLDLGTGTGSLAVAVQKIQPRQRLVVMDIAHGMTRKARQRMDGVFACDGDARSLPFADASFSCVVSSSVYQWVDDLPVAFAEVARILKPGGTFAVALFGDRTLGELRDSHRQAISACGLGRVSHAQSFPTQRAVVTALKAAKLSCELHDSSMEVEFHADVPSLLRQLKRIGASNASVERPRGLSSRRVMQTMIGFYEENFGCEQGLPASYEVIVALARRPG